MSGRSPRASDAFLSSEQSEEYYKRICERNARHYSAEVPYYQSAGQRPAELTALAGLRAPPTLILDVGCGAGRFTTTALESGHSTVGIDRTEAAVAAAVRRTMRYGVRARYVVGDMTCLPFPNVMFDYVFCPRFSINAVATIPRRRDAVNEMVRVVKPGGMVFIETFNRWWLGTSVLAIARREIGHAWTYVKLFAAWLMQHPYRGLLPGDIVYPASKVAYAPPGFAHLPSPCEIRRLIPLGVSATLRSSRELGRNTMEDHFRIWRYSLWLTLTKNVDDESERRLRDGDGQSTVSDVYPL